MLNEVTLIGNLGRDPELKEFESGSKVCEVSLATSETYLNRDKEKVTDTEWHTLKAWGGLANVLGSCLKGERICVKGKIKYRKWEAEDGSKRHATEIVIHKIIFLSSKSDPGTGDPDQEDIEEAPW